MSLKSANDILKIGSIALVVLAIFGVLANFFTRNEVALVSLQQANLPTTEETVNAFLSMYVPVTIGLGIIPIVVCSVFAFLCKRSTDDNNKIMPAFVFSIVMFILSLFNIPAIGQPIIPVVVKIISVLQIVAYLLCLVSAITIKKQVGRKIQ